MPVQHLRLRSAVVSSSILYKVDAEGFLTVAEGPRKGMEPTPREAKRFGTMANYHVTPPRGEAEDPPPPEAPPPEAPPPEALAVVEATERAALLEQFGGLYHGKRRAAAEDVEPTYQTREGRTATAKADAAVAEWAAERPPVELKALIERFA
jgi:hypothetical protein